MAWVRVGDEALSHPKLMSLYDVEGAEDISLLEMFGFLMALATYSAKHLTDGIIERGAAFRDGDRSTGCASQSMRRWPQNCLRGLRWTARRNCACSRMKSSFISSPVKRLCGAAPGRGRTAIRTRKLL